VAFQLPDAIVAAVESWADAATAGVDGLRRVRREALHVTLCFLGTVPVAEIDGVARACEAVRDAPAAECGLGEVLWLPQRRPRVLALGVTDAGGALAVAQRTLSGALSGGGWYEPERRPFRPHVTVGRFRRAGGHATALAAPPALAFTGSTVVLMRSLPERGGSRYERLAAVELTGPEN
jgi:2'-5' RNA ligase